MKKILKWFLILTGIFIFIGVVAVATVFISHDRYGFYPTGGKLSELQSHYDALAYDIHLEVFSEEQAIKGFTTITLQSLSDDLAILELDLIDNFEISKVLIADQELSFQHNDQKLRINLNQNVKQGETLDVCVYYEGQPIEAIMPPWIVGFNWSKDAHGDDWVGLSTQGEGGKIWFPCKAHPSDEPDRVELHITVPKPYTCASNGILQSITEPREGFQTFHWLTTYPINNYNITLNIAKFEIIEKSYTSIDGNEIPVVYYHLTEDKEKANQLVDMAIDMLETFETYFGEYPFAKEKFGLVETSYLGMEHQTMNSYGNDYKMTTRQNFEFDSLMLHEMSHEWWGNKVTVKDWADFWIHEGLGTYSEALYVLAKTGEAGYHEHMASLKKKIRNKSPVLGTRNAKSNESYSGDIYFKGASIMHSLRFILGDTDFFSTLRQFATDPAYTYHNLGCTDDFISLVHQNSDQDLSGFFRLYLETTSLPSVLVVPDGPGKWQVSIPNIEFELPMELEHGGETGRYVLGKEPIRIESQAEINVDPRHWYFLEGDLKKD